MKRRHNPGPQRRRHHRAAAPYNNPPLPGIPRTFVTSEGKTYNFDDVLPLTSEVFEIYNESESAFDLQDVAKVDKAIRFWSEFQPKESRHYVDQFLYENLRGAIPLRKSDWNREARDAAHSSIQWLYMHLSDAFSEDPDGLDLEDRAKIEEGIKEIRVNPVARAVARRHNPGPQRRRHHRAAAPYNNPLPRTFVTSWGKTYNTDDVLPLSDELIEIFDESGDAFDLQELEEVDKAMRFWWEFQPKTSRHYFDQRLYESLRAAIPLRKSDWNRETIGNAYTSIDVHRRSLMHAFEGVQPERRLLEMEMEDVQVNPIAIPLSVLNEGAERALKTGVPQRIRIKKRNPRRRRRLKRYY